MPDLFRVLLRAPVLAPALAVLLTLSDPAPAVPGGEAPILAPRPVPGAAPRAAWRAAQPERERRADWLEWQWERGDGWRGWLRARREAGDALDQERRKEWLERRRVEPDGQVRELGDRLDGQWRRQRERWEGRRVGEPRGPNPLRPSRD